MLVKWTKKTVLRFGKHNGETIGSILQSDPTYLKWCCENVDEFSENLQDGLEEEIDEAAKSAEYERLQDFYDEEHW